MKAVSIAARKGHDQAEQRFATIAAQELQLRIAASGLLGSLVAMACEFCLEEVPVEEAFQKIQEVAIEKMVRMLDADVLDDDYALTSCLETVTRSLNGLPGRHWKRERTCSARDLRFWMAVAAWKKAVC